MQIAAMQQKQKKQLQIFKISQWFWISANGLFDCCKSATMINKQLQDQLFTTFNTSITAEECKSQLVAHRETVFLLLKNFGNQKLNLFHHLTEIGCTLYDASVHQGRCRWCQPSSNSFTCCWNYLHKTNRSRNCHSNDVDTLWYIRHWWDWCSNKWILKLQTKKFYPCCSISGKVHQWSHHENNGSAKEILVRVREPNYTVLSLKFKKLTHCMQEMHIIKTEQGLNNKISCSRLTLFLKNVTKSSQYQQQDTKKFKRQQSLTLSSHLLHMLVNSAFSNQELLRQLTTGSISW